MKAVQYLLTMVMLDAFCRAKTHNYASLYICTVLYIMSLKSGFLSEIYRRGDKRRVDEVEGGSSMGPI